MYLNDKKDIIPKAYNHVNFYECIQKFILN